METNQREKLIAEIAMQFVCEEPNGKFAKFLGRRLGEEEEKAIENIALAQKKFEEELQSLKNRLRLIPKPQKQLFLIQ